MLYVNIHEPEEIKEYLRKAAEIKVSSFTPGDYLIGNIAIERKTINDFLGSLVQKRLFEQLSRMKSCYPSSFLIVEAFDLSHFRNAKAIYGAILKIILEMNIKVIFTQSKEQTAEVILLLAGRSGSDTTLRHKTKETGFAQQQFSMLERVPGVGKMRARILLEKFGSLKEVFEARKKDLRTVEGIGKKTAKNIKKMWKGE